MKKLFLFLVLIVALVGIIGAWLLFGSATSFTDNKKYLYVYTGKANETAVMKFIEENELLKHPAFFKWIADKMGVWNRIKPGKYEIKKGENILNIARALRNNRQSPVNLVINKLRTEDDLAELIAKNFESDSSEVINFINNDDSIANLGVNSSTFMTIVIPNTYTMFWNTSSGKIFRRLKTEQENFWQKNNRTQKASALGFTPDQIYTIASMVEEETNKLDEKGNVASVYINRVRTGMRLVADPTVKFALKDFCLKRIYEKHLQVESPYNTYKVSGLPPGPICTPSSKTIDAVLNSPKTDYLYFVAKSDFSGYHTFTTNYNDHLQKAREYQKALDELILRKQNAAKKDQ